MHIDVDETDTPRSLQVLCFGDDQAALVAGPQLARFTASTGIPTTLVPGEHPAVTPLRAAGAVVMRSATPRACSRSIVETLLRRARGLTFLVGVEAVDRSDPALRPCGGSREAVVAVSSGFADADELARLALAATDAGYEVEGVMVVNPDPGDTTIGSREMVGDRSRSLSKVPASRSSQSTTEGTPSVPSQDFADKVIADRGRTA